MNNNFENQNIPLKFLNRRPKFIHSESELNNFIKFTILEWAENDFTCPYAIQTFISQVIEPAQMKAYFAQCYNNIHSMKEHISFIQSVNSHIWALFSCRPAVSFYDVFKLIDALCTPTNRNTIGPLTKIPIVKAYIFNNVDVRNRTPEIRLSDLILDCALFLNEKISSNKNKNEESIVNSLSEKQFLHFLKMKYSVFDFNLLGVKITNFKALKEAAYAAKCESFHLLLSSEKLTKLLRSDVKEAMKNVREKLSQTDLFKFCNKSAEVVKEFASLPFKDSIKQAFELFIDEQTLVASKHGLPLETVDRCLIDAKNAAKFLMDNEFHGEIFQLATVGAATANCTAQSQLRNHEPFDQLKNANIDQWKCRIFAPLMNDINGFLNLVSIGQRPSGLAGDHQRIIDKCRAISQLLNDIDCNSTQIHKSKLILVNNLANCTRRIVDQFSHRGCLANSKKLAVLQLDLLPQAYTLLVSLMSRCQLVKRPSSRAADLGSPAVTHNLIQSLFKAKFIDFIQARKFKDGKFSFETVAELEKEILEVLDAPSWPLEGRFIDYFIGNRDEMQCLINSLSNRSGSPDENGEHTNTETGCQCISVRPDFISQLVKMVPKQVSMETFLSHTLTNCHGIKLSNENKKSISAIWNDQDVRQAHLLEDGAAPAIDLRMSLFRGSIAADSALSDAESVMQAISRVGLMENAAAYMRWDAIHRSFWGDIGQFINAHADLASAHNIRILLSAIGAIRINAKCCPIDQLDNHVTNMSVISTVATVPAIDSSTKSFMGNILSLFIPDSPSSSLPICHLINRLTNQLDSPSNFIRFSLACINFTPPELLASIVTHLLFPLSNRVCEPADTTRTLQSIFTLCSRNDVVMTLLKAQLGSLSNHPVLDIIRCTEAQRQTEIDRNIDSTTNVDIQGLIATETESNRPIAQPISIEIDPIEEWQEESDLVIVTRASRDDSKKNEENCQSIVSDIRRNEFGIGLMTSDSSTNQVMENFNAKMARLVEHLSNDLYANASHFILELIQNADDNSYSAHIRPRLELMWRDEGASLVLDVINNEKGFTESDLRALCDIGCSTKSKYRNNKIGRKGIGFKSVFLVSDRPEVHSNGFHVRFERFRLNEDNVKVSNNALVPTWIDCPSVIDDCLQTLIRLPIIPSLTNHIQLTVTHQIKPHLLLFLRNLTRISMTSPSADDGTTRKQFIELVQEECTVNHRAVQCDNGQKHSWFLRTQQIPILEPEILRISPRNLSVTELSVAIPLAEQELEDCPTFAFLPIRSYGFRFIINADFSIPASREDISNECPWNRWLIEQVPLVFTECLLEFTSRDHVQNTIRAIKCIPLPGEVPTDSSFHVLVPKIRAQLVQLAWLPDRNGKLHPPSQLIVESVDDSSLTSALCNRLSLTLLHPLIANSSDERVSRALGWLGCQTLSLQHLGRLLTALQPEDIADPVLMKSIIIAIHSGLERDPSIATCNRLIAQLLSMPIWPVLSRSGAPDRFVSINQSALPIFIPPSHWPNTHNNDLYSCLRLMISPAFIASFKTSANKKHINVASSVLQRLGVHELNSNTMIDHAIIPRLSNECQSRNWLIAAAQFLVDHCHPSQYRDRVIPLLSFATVSYNHSNGKMNCTITHYSDLYKVHLPNQLEKTMTTVLPLIHNRIDYTVLDDAYLDCPIQPEQWREFFCAAGTSETFYRVAHDNGNAQHEYPEIDALLGLNDKRVNVDLLRYLDINWAHLSAPKYQGVISHFLGRPSIPVCASYDALNQSDQLLDLSLPLRSPSESLFLCSSNPNKALLPNSLLAHFPICPVMFSSRSLPNQLSMIDEINANHILTLLKRIFIEKSLSFTGKQSIDFYNWIKQNLSSISLINLISEFRSLLGGATLVAVPSGDDSDECELLISQSCYWTIPIADVSSSKYIFIQDQQVSEDLKQMVSTHAYRNRGESCSLVNVFPGLKELFVDIMGIREFPSVSEIWGTVESLLALLSSERLKELNNAEVELITDVYNLVRFLDQNDNRDNRDEGTCRPEISELPLLPCLSGNYRAFIDSRRPIVIYSWRSYETVHAFQQHLYATDQAGTNSPIDFLSLSLTTKRDTANHHHFRHSQSTRWTAAQFVAHYFNPPVLEDDMEFHVDNRESFIDCADVKLMMHHLEAIVQEWFQRNMPKEATALCVNKLSSLTSFRSSSDDVLISVSLRTHPSIRYRYSDKIYIGAIDEEAHCHELLLGGIDLYLERLVAMSTVMDALIAWILDGDRYNHSRERFRKFYRSLFDLIETSDDNQVSIFIRSHNLRVNPSSIDYIFAVVRSVKEEEEEEEHVEGNNGEGLDKNALESIDCGQTDPSSPVETPTTVAIVTESMRRTLKRKRISISIENIIPTKQICLSNRNEEREESPSVPTSDCTKSIDNANVSHREINAESDNQSELAIDTPETGTVKAIGNRKLKVKTGKPIEPIANNESPQSVLEPVGGERISTLSLRLKEQTDSQKEVRLSMAGLTPDNMAQMSGRIGEQLAYQKLTANQRLGEWEILRVDWLNRERESRLPYDFKISARRSDSSVADKIYLEVKATTQQSKLQFDLSPQEVTAAWSFKEHYHLLLVFHSGSYPDTNTRFIHIPDTLGQLQDNQCKLLLDVSALLQN